MFAFKTLEEKFQTIPDDVKEAILSTEVNKKLQGIIERHHLQLDEGEKLTKEIGYVMLGLKKPEDFVKNVQIATELDRTTAEEIVNEVNETIFKEIKDSLRKIYNEKEQANLSEEEVDEATQEQLRQEMLQELKKGKTEKDDGLIIQSDRKTSTTKKTVLPKIEKETIEEHEPNQISSENPTEKVSSQSTDTHKPNQPKKYIIDPYREPID